MFRDYRMGQRLSGATIRRLLGDYHARTSDYSATIQRLFRDYSKRAAWENRAAFLIADELAAANQRGWASS